MSFDWLERFFLIISLFNQTKKQAKNKCLITTIAWKKPKWHNLDNVNMKIINELQHLEERNTQKKYEDVQFVDFSVDHSSKVKGQPPGCRRSFRKC